MDYTFLETVKDACGFENSRWRTRNASESEVWLAEEGREAELALSQLLQAYKLERPRWHDGFYSKPIKEMSIAVYSHLEQILGANSLI